MAKCAKCSTKKAKATVCFKGSLSPYYFTKRKSSKQEPGRLKSKDSILERLSKKTTYCSLTIQLTTSTSDDIIIESNYPSGVFWGSLEKVLQAM